MLFIELDKKIELVKSNYKFINDITSSSGRLYVFDVGSFPSVTTVLSTTADKSWLEEWKLRVGEEEARRVSRMASLRGTEMHNTLERIVRGEKVRSIRVMPDCILQVKGIIKILESEVDSVLGIETPLVSPKYKIAGRTDLITGNTLTIRDYKSSKREKKESEIVDYFLQSTIYAIMAEETLNISPTHINILIACDNGVVQSFTRLVSEFRDAAIDRIKEYYARTKNA